MSTVKITATKVLGRDLQPGDLFSTVGPKYWAVAMDRGSVGERVYIRTNTPAELYDDLDEVVYRITIENSNIDIPQDWKL